VTPDHVMISEKKLFQAKNLKIGMMLGNDEIKKLEMTPRKTKITVVTETGTILVNGLLATTICGDYMESKGNSV